jgi:hypothetical protein
VNEKKEITTCCLENNTERRDTFDIGFLTHSGSLTMKRVRNNQFIFF